MKRFMEQTATSPVYEGVQLKHNNEDKLEVSKWICKVALAVLSRLAERFPDSDMTLMKAFDVFNLDRCPSNRSESAEYGSEEVNMLIDHYVTSKSFSGKVFDPQINAEMCRLQWKLIVQALFKAKQQGKSSSDFWQNQLSGGHLGTLECIHFLVCVWLVLPYSTCCCERGFSRMKLIKSELRNRMYVETLDALMTLSIVGPRYLPEDESDTSEVLRQEFFQAVVEDWEEQKIRMPHQARFGNQNARKNERTAHTKTELPLDKDHVVESDDGDNTGFDQVADEDEHNEAGVASTRGVHSNEHNHHIEEDVDVEPFLVPVSYVTLSTALDLSKETLKRIPKYAYKFNEGWETCTFKGFYKGKNSDHKCK